MSFASWPYDRSTTNPINTLSGRIARPAVDDAPHAMPDRPVATSTRFDREPEQYRWSMAGLVRAVRGTS
jgi:hypothetical protein